MDIRQVLPYFIILLLTPSRADLCEQVKCLSGSVCIQGSCRNYVEPLLLISNFNNSYNNCGDIICKVGEACVKSACVEISIAQSIKTPPKPSVPGVLRRAISPYGTNYCE